MSSANKKLLEDIFAEVKDLKKIQENNLIKQDAIEEMCHLMLRLINDLGAKKDLDICVTNLKNAASKTSKKKSGSSSEKKKMNIMAYFKYKYTENPESIYDVISKEEIEKVLKSHESELKSKKKGTIEQAKATFIYRDLISGNKLNQTRLRTKKEQEEEAETVHQEEIIEYEVVEEKIERADNLAYEDIEDEVEEDDEDEEDDEEED
jgi:hypothetical protein